MSEKRYWEIAWDIHPNSNSLQAMPQPNYKLPAKWEVVPKTVDEETISEKMLELLTRPRLGFGDPIDKSFPKTVHNIGSLGAGGAERQLVNFLIEMSKRGHHNQTLLTVYPPEGAAGHYAPLLSEHNIQLKTNNSPVTKAGIKIIRDNFEIVQAIKSIPFSLNAWVLDLWVELSLERPAIAHFWLDHSNIWGGIAAVLAGVPKVILSGRNVNPSNFPYLYTDYMKPWYTWLMACDNVHMLNNSTEGAESYAAWLDLPRDRIDVVLNGVNLEHLSPANSEERAQIRTSLNIPMDVPVVVGAFRLSEEKRPELFVETFAKARESHPTIHAVHMGEGPYLDAVRAKVESLGLKDCFHLLGRRSDLAKVVTSMDVLLHTAFWEGTPNVVLEAQQLCMPIVVTDAGGTKDAAYHGKTGYCVPKHDEAALAVRLTEVLADLQKWRESAKAGQDFVRDRFSVERMVNDTLRVQKLGLENLPLHPKLIRPKGLLARWWYELVN